MNRTFCSCGRQRDGENRMRRVESDTYKLFAFRRCSDAGARHHVNRPRAQRLTCARKDGVFGLAPGSSLDYRLAQGSGWTCSPRVPCSPPLLVPTRHSSLADNIIARVAFYNSEFLASSARFWIQYARPSSRGIYFAR